MPRWIPATAVFLGLLLTGRAQAQSGGLYSLGWNTLDGGGQTFSSGGVYQVGSTAGQPDAARATGGAYTLQGGFWGPAVASIVAAPPFEPVPLAFTARLPQPNPSASITTLVFELPAARRVTLVVYGIDGRVVRGLAQGAYDAGSHRATWDGRDDRGRPVGSGIYFARLVAGEFKSTLRIVRLD